MISPSVRVEKRGVFTGHRDCVYTLEPAAHPATFFSAGGDGMVVGWDLTQPDQGVLVAQVPHSVYALHYLPQTDTLLVGHNYEGIHAVAVTERQEKHSVKITAGAIFDLKTRGDDLYVATSEGRVLRLHTQSLVTQQTATYAPVSARCVAVHPSGYEIAVGYSDHYIRVLDPVTLAVRYAWRAHQNSVFSLTYSPEGQWLVSGSRDARLKVWEVSEGYAPAHEVVAHLFAINHLVYSPTGTHLATGSMDKSVKVWDATDFRLLKVIDRARHAGHGTSVNKLHWAAHEHLLVSGSDDRTLSVWQLHFPAQ